jgi:leucine dehydrogenase
LRLGTDSLDGIRVAVQGVGHVGLNLCRLLHEAGAIITIADVNPEHLSQASSEIPATEVAPADLLFADVDVIAPCALGNILTSTTIDRITAKVIAGASNNQLATQEDGARLTDRDILYAPDYVINAGGIISVAHEYYGNSSEENVRADVARIPGRLDAIFAEAKSSGRPTNIIADELAQRIVASGGNEATAAA